MNTLTRIGTAMLVVALSQGGQCASAKDFRVDTMVFVDDDRDSICQTVTWFQGNRIYDRLSEDRDEVTIIDMALSQITILDLGQNCRCELSFEAIRAFVRDATAAAPSSPAFVSFAAKPRFETSEEQNGSFLLRGSSLSYRVQTLRAPHDEVTRKLKDFADWSARLNTLRPGLPPNARLELNQKLFQRKRIPKVVTCEIAMDVNRQRRFISRHEYCWQLSSDDRAQLARFDRLAREFPSVAPKTLLATTPAATVDR